MGHTKAENLKDLDKELKVLEKMDGVKQTKPGIFYLKTIPFLHFHDDGEKRWADVKRPEGGWSPVEIDFKANAKQKAEFLKTAAEAYTKLSAPKGKAKK